MIAPRRKKSFQVRLLAWYAAHGRALPWRKTRDPYAILVSEILSHQTQISRVVPVYEQLLGRYPTVDALAAAPLDEVKAITDPLGYKVRGEWLHGAALQVADRLGGRFPRTLDGLRALPGVGPYTAGAVMNFAYRKDAPALDTNVARVLRRHFAVSAEQRARPVSLWQLARAIIPAGKGYLLNQALMDLGAMVCGARAPRCTVCPVQRSCAFRRSRGLQGGRAAGPSARKDRWSNGRKSEARTTVNRRAANAVSPGPIVLTDAIDGPISRKAHKGFRLR